MQEAAEETRVIYESRDLLAFYKEKGLATVPLKNNEGDSLLKRIGEIYPEVLSVKGKNPWEGGIIHRLDTPTSGLVLAARNQDAYDELHRAQKEDLILKRYRAEVSKKENLLPGFEDFPYKWNGEKLSILSYFRSYGVKGASVRPVMLNKRNIAGSIYRTDIIKIDENTFDAVITRGFRHQIRCHLSWAGYPITGDDRYGGDDNPYLLLESYSMKFPFKGKTIEITL